MKVRPSITSREINQNSGRVLRAVRDEHVIVPVTYGSDPAPIAYIVPAEVMSDREAALEAVSLAGGRVMSVNGRSLRESFEPVESSLSRAVDILEELREDRV